MAKSTLLLFFLLFISTTFCSKVQSELIGNSDALISQYFNDINTSYLSREDLADLLCIFFTGRTDRKMQSVLREFKEDKHLNKPNWLENDSIQYLMIKRYIDKNYEEEKFDREFVKNVLQNQYILASREIIDYVTQEIEDIDKNHK